MENTNGAGSDVLEFEHDVRTCRARERTCRPSALGREFEALFEIVPLVEGPAAVVLQASYHDSRSDPDPFGEVACLLKSDEASEVCFKPPWDEDLRREPICFLFYA